MSMMMFVVQVHKPSEGGEWHLEHTPCIEVLVRNKSAILNALTDAKYDKITHVRQAVGKALVEMDCIPSPKSKPTIASMLSGEDSDLETLLNPKRPKSNSRPWSGDSNGPGRTGARKAPGRPEDAFGTFGDALEGEESRDYNVPSPRSDMGTSFEPEEDDGDSPRGNRAGGRRKQPLHESMQSMPGSRRQWAGNTSGGLSK